MKLALRCGVCSKRIRGRAVVKLGRGGRIKGSWHKRHEPCRVEVEPESRLEEPALAPRDGVRMRSADAGLGSALPRLDPRCL